MLRSPAVNTVGKVSSPKAGTMPDRSSTGKTNKEVLQFIGTAIQGLWKEAKEAIACASCST
jgi:hypothetical protein